MELLSSSALASATVPPPSILVYLHALEYQTPTSSPISPLPTPATYFKIQRSDRTVVLQCPCQRHCSSRTPLVSLPTSEYQTTISSPLPFPSLTFHFSLSPLSLSLSHLYASLRVSTPLSVSLLSSSSYSKFQCSDRAVVLQGHRERFYSSISYQRVLRASQYQVQYPLLCLPLCSPTYSKIQRSDGVVVL